MRPGRIEMINPEYELLGDGDADSTEVGRIVPIYEAIGGISSRIDAAHRLSGARTIFRRACPIRCPRKFWRGTNFLRGATRSTSCIFRPQTESVEALNSFRSPAHQRLIFEEFFFYQLSVAMRKKSAQQQAGDRLSRARAGHPRSDQARAAVQAHRGAEAGARRKSRRTSSAACR